MTIENGEPTPREVLSSPDPVSFGTFLRALREERGIPLEDMWKTMGYKSSTLRYQRVAIVEQYASFEADETIPLGENLRRLEGDEKYPGLGLTHESPSFLDLAQREGDIVTFVQKDPEEVHSRGEIFNAVYHETSEAFDSAVTSNVSHINRRIREEELPINPVHGINTEGYTATSNDQMREIILKKIEGLTDEIEVKAALPEGVLHFRTNKGDLFLCRKRLFALSPLLAYESPIPLSRQEADYLKVMMEQPTTPQTFQMLRESTVGRDRQAQSRAGIKVVLSTLRQKLGTYYEVRPPSKSRKIVPQKEMSLIVFDRYKEAYTLRASKK